MPNFRDMVDNAVHGVLVHSNFKPLYVNNAFARLFGYKSSEDIMALPLIRPLYPVDTWPEVEMDYNDLIRGKKKPVIDRERALRADGSEFWMSSTRRAMDWYGTPAVQISAFDISQQMELEQLLLRNEQLLSSVLEILPVPVYIARRSDGRILFVNRKTCFLLQQGAGALLKSHALDFFCDADDLGKIHQLIDTVRDVREIEVRLRTAQGHEFTAEIAAIAMEYVGQAAVLFSMNDVSERKKLEQELFHQANTDALTGLSNRRHFMVLAEQEMRRARRFNRTLSIVMMDLDRFKWINDSLGHAAGDAVLNKLSQVSLESLRDSDVMGRLGGEEFAILLPETGLDAAVEVANRLRSHVEETCIQTSKGEIHCTTSLGIAQLAPGDTSIDDLLHRADEALYRAKNSGRNKVETQET